MTNKVMKLKPDFISVYCKFLSIWTPKIIIVHVIFLNMRVILKCSYACERCNRALDMREYLMINFSSTVFKKNVEVLS